MNLNAQALNRNCHTKAKLSFRSDTIVYDNLKKLLIIMNIIYKIERDNII